MSNGDILNNSKTKKWPPYSSYKPSRITWIGETPTHWETKPIKYIFKIINGATPKSGVEEFWEGDIPWATPDDLGDLSSDTITKTSRKITKLGFSSCATSIAPKGSLVLSTRAPIGHLAIAGVDLCTNQGCRCLVFRKDDAKKYFYYCLLGAKAELQSWGQGSTFTELGSQSLGSTFVVCPPVEEQLAIANFLDRETEKIDALIAKKERHIELLQERRNALITQAVTKGLEPSVPMKSSGIDWLGPIPAHWKINRIKHLCRPTRGQSPRPIDDPVYFDDGGEYSWVRISDVTASNKYLLRTEQKLSIFGKSKCLALEPGELFVSIAASVGKPIITSIKCCIHDGFVALYGFRRNREYAYYALLCEGIFSGLGKLGTQLNLNSETIGNIIIPDPPMPEQEAIVFALNRETAWIDDLASKVEEAIEYLKEYRKALISAAVTGKIDVRKEK